MVVGVIKLEKHVEIDMTKTDQDTSRCPGADGLRGHSRATLPWDVTHLDGEPSNARCRGSLLSPLRQARLTLSQLCCSICFQSRVKNAGTSTCQKSFKHSPADSLQPYTHSDLPDTGSRSFQSVKCRHVTTQQVKAG